MARSGTNRIARLAFAAGLLILSAVVSGCAISPPQKNVFVWDLKRDHAVRRAHTTRVAVRDTVSTRTIIRPRPKPSDTPRQQPGWYTASDTVMPAPATHDVTPQQTALDTGSVRFEWPVQGRVIADFGSTASGERNDGINIATQLGTPIHAAAAGTVSYAGNELKGYGNLVLIRHDDDYVTAYAHAERLIVARGDTVAKGQVIGYAGDTGDVTEPQLHFEIRHGVEPVNPRPLLVASR